MANRPGAARKRRKTMTPTRKTSTLIKVRLLASGTSVVGFCCLSRFGRCAVWLGRRCCVSVTTRTPIY